MHVMRNDVEDHVPYWTTAVFVKGMEGWQWRYWGIRATTVTESVSHPKWFRVDQAGSALRFQFLRT
jgi:hypothetical protein